MLVVVLGASGFIGTAIGRELATRTIRLRLVSRRAIPAPVGIAEVETVAADLTEPGAVAAAIAGADVVIHLVAHIEGSSTWRVAEGDSAAQRVNVGLVRDLIDAIESTSDNRRPVVLFAGSISQVGRPAGARVDGSEPDAPAAEYDRQKLAAEHALLAATESGALRGIVLRLATVYGQGTTPFELEHGVVSAMLRKAVAGEPLTMWGDGTVARDLICVDDVARAFLAAMDHADALAGRSWLIGTGTATSIRDLFTSIARAVSSRTGRPVVPVVSVRPDEADASDAVDFVVGSAAFGEVTGWSPTVSLAEGLDLAAAAVGS